METKFHTLQPWLPEILETIRRDIKTDYLPASATVYRAHFGNRPLNRLTMTEISDALTKELLQGNEDLAEWVVNRWVFKHGEIYSHFAQRLEAIRPDFTELESLTEAESEQVLKGAQESFGVKPVYFFSVLNGVVFPASVFDALRAATEAHKEPEEASSSVEDAAASEKHKKDLAKLAEKYEQKIAGVMKKYTTEVEALKKQIRALQKRVG